MPISYDPPSNSHLSGKEAETLAVIVAHSSGHVVRPDPELAENLGIRVSTLNHRKQGLVAKGYLVRGVHRSHEVNSNYFVTTPETAVFLKKCDELRERKKLLTEEKLIEETRSIFANNDNDVMASINRCLDLDYLRRYPSRENCIERGPLLEMHRVYIELLLQEFARL